MTQIIERVARAICETGPMDPDEIGANDGPNWQRYIPHAQAALKEIKFEQLVGALKMAAQHIISEYGTDGGDHEFVGYFGGGQQVDFTFGQVRLLQALLSELEKTDA